MVVIPIFQIILRLQMKSLTTFYLFLFFILPITLFATPVNDLCVNAIPVAVNTGVNCLTTVSGTTDLATSSQNGCAGTANDDVWFSFTATSTDHYIAVQNITAVTGTSIDMVHQVFEGNCGALLSLYCSDPNASNYPGYIVGNTYYIRVYSYFTSSSQTFDLCIGVVPASVSNDNCGTAAAIPVNPGIDCINITPAHNVNATNSGVTGCTGNANDDVWFIFFPTQTTHIIKLSNVQPILGASTDLVHEVFSGSNCSSITSLSCSDPNSSIVSGLTVGATHYLRVYSYGSTNQQSFDICVLTIPPTPPNDVCSGAINLPLDSAVCVNTTTGHNYSTTDSGALPTPSCGNYQGGDIWYTVSVPPSGNLAIDFSNFDFSSVGASLYSGTCGALTQVKCEYFGWPIIFSNLQQGTHYIRIWDFGNDDPGLVDICVYEPVIQPPPPNDNCNSSISVPINPIGQCVNIVNGTTLSATTSFNACVGTANDDVWFSFQATETQHSIDILNIVAIYGQSVDMVHEVFEGNCTGIVSIGCSDDNSSTVGNLVVGTIYYVRVHSFSNSSSQTFDICIGTPPPPPANDECSGAIFVPTNFTPLCQTVVSSTTENAFSSMNGCVGTANDDVWFKFTAASDQHSVEILNIVAVSGVSVDMVFQVFESACGALIPIECSDPNTTILTGLTPGDTYYIRVYSYFASSSQTFDICIGQLPPKPAYDDCSSPIPLPVQPGSCVNFLSLHNFSTTDSGELPIPTCGNYQGGDIWAAVTSPASGNLNIDIGSYTFSTVGGALYSGSCGALVAVACADFNWPIEITGPPNTPYLLRLYDYANDDNGLVQVCAYEPYECEITDIVLGNQSNCNPVTNTYSQELIVTYDIDPFLTVITVNGEIFIATGSPQTITLNNLYATGNPVDVTASFAGATNCNYFEASLFTAPSLCIPEPSTTCSQYSSSPNGTIDSNLPPVVDIITVTGTFPSILTDLNVVVEVEHSYISDLEITLTSPLGTSVDLMFDQCVDEEDINIRFDDQGYNLTCSTPTIGIFKPTDGSLSDFIGERFDGNWVLEITDDEAGDEGVLDQWCLEPTLVTGVRVNIKTLLEGPYQSSTGLMKDNLRTGFLIPLQQPYAAAPWNYTGTEDIPFSLIFVGGVDAIVDWVLVEIRSAANPTTVLAQRAGLLQTDGDIVDIDGVSPLLISGITDGDYYVVIHHRTHLSAMTATPVTLTAAIGPTVDLSGAPAYGTNGTKLVGGAYVLYEGDAFHDDVVNAADRSALWNERNAAGYLQEDTNMDGQCNAADRSQNWNNRNVISQVP